MKQKPRFPGIRVTANGNQLVSYHTEARIADAGIFYPITPSTEGGELYQQAFAEGKGKVFIDRPKYDDSASKALAQISVPVIENGRAIGVITVGVTPH